MLLNACLNLIAQAKDFEEDLVIVDIKNSGMGASPMLSTLERQAHGRGAHATVGIESIYKALILGLRDYVRKCGFKSVVVGLSGGIDSALTACIAVDALGSGNVVGVLMPSEFSSRGSIEDSERLGNNLGIELLAVPITTVFQAYNAALKPLSGRAGLSLFARNRPIDQPHDCILRCFPCGCLTRLDGLFVQVNLPFP